MIQIQQLYYFQKVAEIKSMNKAAKLLFVTQPNLSKSIQNLEKDLNITLFKRNSKGMSLTSAGKKLFSYTNAIIRQFEIIHSISDQEQKKRLSVSAYPDLSNFHFIKTYYKHNKITLVDVLLEEQRIETVISNVETLISEIGIVQYNQLQKKKFNHVLKIKNLEFNELGHDTWYAHVGKNHPLYEQKSIGIKDLLEFPVLRTKDDFFSSLSYFLEIEGVSFLEFKRHIFTNNGITQLKLLQETEAFSFGPGFSKEEYLKMDIRLIPINHCNIDVTIGWIKRKNEELSSEAADFLEIVRTFFVPINQNSNQNSHDFD